MKLIYIANARIPTEKAHGIQIMKMCEAFASLEKCDVDLELIVPIRFNYIKENPFAYYNVRKNFNIRRLPCIDLIPLSRYLGSVAFWVQAVSFLVVARLYLLFKKYDALYSRDFFAGFLFNDFSLELHSLPKQIRKVHRKIWRKAKGIIVLTSFIKKRLIEDGVPKRKIIVAPDAVDLEEFDINVSKEAARKKFRLPLDKKIIMYTGHLYDWKGGQVLANASKLLSNDYLIIFVGGTQEDVAKFKERNKNCHNILILEHKLHKEIPMYLKSADILVLPNTGETIISKEYTSPIKLFEYMAAKRVTVASDLPSIREMLNDNNAWLVKPGDPVDLADGIIKLFSSEDLGNRLLTRAFNEVKNFTWQKRAGNIIDFIKEKI